MRLREEYPNQFYLLSYEELLKDTEGTVKKVFNFCGLNFSDQTESFIKKSTSNAVKDDDAYSVFKSKSKDDAWKKDLPSYIVEEINTDLDFKKLNTLFNWCDK